LNIEYAPNKIVLCDFVGINCWSQYSCWAKTSLLE